MERKNAAVLFGIHGNINSIFNKTSGEYTRVSEFLVIKKLSKKFKKIYIFSHDSKKYNNILPSNAKHILLYNQFFYLIFGWLILLSYVRKKNIKLIYLECSAIPMIFLVTKLSKAKIVLNYNYLLHKIYGADKNINFRNKITKNKFISVLVKPIEKFLISFIDYFIITSKEIENFVSKKKKIDIKKGIVIKNFDKDRVRENPIFKKIGGPTIIFTGRLVPVKNPLMLIEAYKIAKRKIPNLNLIIAGDGELMEDCRKAADKDTHLLGFAKDIPGLLKGSDIFVSTSDYDASPRSLMEAMAMAKPCIATNVGGVPDYLDDTCGILIPPKNPHILAEKIVYLLQNKGKARELGRRARERMLRDHDLDKNLDKMIDFMIKQIEKEEHLKTTR